MTPNQRQRINEAVAEHVFGGAERCGFLCPECGSEYFGSDPKTGVRECHDQYDNGCHEVWKPEDALPEYCESWSGMGLVVKEMERRGYEWSMRFEGSREDSHCYVAGFGGGGDPAYEKAHDGVHKDAAVAVSIAALRSLGQSALVSEIVGDKQ